MVGITLDELAEMIGKGFSEMNGKFDKVDDRLEKLEAGQASLVRDIESLRNEMERQFALVHKRIDDLSKTMVFRDELDTLKQAVHQLQQRPA